MDHIELDRAALNDRFQGGMDVEALQVLVENQPVEEIDESRIYSFWVIDPAGSDRVERGPSAMIEQVGIAMFRIIVPAGTYLEDAYEARAKFVELFRDWRSDDKALTVLGFMDSKKNVKADPTTKEPAYVALDVQFSWISRRPRQS